MQSACSSPPVSQGRSREAGGLVDQDAVVLWQIDQPVGLSGEPHQDSAPTEHLAHTWMAAPPGATHTHTHTQLDCVSCCSGFCFSNVFMCFHGNRNQRPGVKDSSRSPGWSETDREQTGTGLEADWEQNDNGLGADWEQTPPPCAPSPCGLWLGGRG